MIQRGTFRSLFVTDLHGSTRCFQKTLSAVDRYQPDLVFFGGDYSSKELFLFAKSGTRMELIGNDRSTRSFSTIAEFDLYRQQQENIGALFHEVSPSELGAIEVSAYLAFFEARLRERLEKWITMARSRIPSNLSFFVIPGNDDSAELDSLFQDPPFRWAHRRHQLLRDDWSVLGWGGSNPTPWQTMREAPESQIASELAETLNANYPPERMVALIHPPPFNSGLDGAPTLTPELRERVGAGGASVTPIGSQAVRRFVERVQPAIGLFGHVHEGRGRTRIGRTLCVNPGSAYVTGRLQAALVDFNSKKVARVALVEG